MVVAGNAAVERAQAASLDLAAAPGVPRHRRSVRCRSGDIRIVGRPTGIPGPDAIRVGGARCQAAVARSEEHTSELQSQSNLVCRLLLEKKKNTHTNRSDYYTSELSSHSHDGRSLLLQQQTKPCPECVTKAVPHPRHATAAQCLGAREIT